MEAGVESILEFSSSLHGKCFPRSQSQDWVSMNRMLSEGEAGTSHNIQGARDAHRQYDHRSEAWGQSPYVPDSCGTYDHVGPVRLLIREAPRSLR